MWFDICCLLVIDVSPIIIGRGVRSVSCLAMSTQRRISPVDVVYDSFTHYVRSLSFLLYEFVVWSIPLYILRLVYTSRLFLLLRQVGRARFTSPRSLHREARASLSKEHEVSESVSPLAQID